MKLKIEYIPIDQLKTYANNAKIHTAEQVEKIKESIQQFGMCDPIAVWHDNEIIEGHGRLFALQELGEKTAPIIRLDHLTDDQRKAYMLIHNKLTMDTDFENDILQIELGDITDIDMTDFGFELEEFELVYPEEEKSEEPEIEFTEILGEEHNYIVLYFDNDVDWLQAESLFDIKPKRNPSTRVDGKIPKGMDRISIGRVLDGAKALESLRTHYENIG